MGGSRRAEPVFDLGGNVAAFAHDHGAHEPCRGLGQASVDDTGHGLAQTERPTPRAIERTGLAGEQFQICRAPHACHQIDALTTRQQAAIQETRIGEPPWQIEPAGEADPVTRCEAGDAFEHRER